MNNLVSKNPVQRFKQGRKIVFAKPGDKMLYNGKEIVTEEILDGQTVYRRENGSYVYSNNKLLSPIKQNSQVSSSIKPSDVTVNIPKLFPENKEQFVPQYQKDVTHNWLKGLRSKYSRPFQKTTVIPQQQTQAGKTTLKKGSITPSVFAGHRIGRTGGLNYNINDADKQQLIGTGQFTESDFTNALATQQALNRYFANFGLGSIKEDNAWGDQSRKALEFALSKSKSLTPFNNNRLRMIEIINRSSNNTAIGNEKIQPQ